MDTGKYNLIIFDQIVFAFIGKNSARLEFPILAKFLNNKFSFFYNL
jgi:hypothetical protein